MSFRRVAIIGAGAFGFALAVHLERARAGQIQLRLYDLDEELMARLSRGEPHPRIESGVCLPAQAMVCDQLQEAVAGTQVAILAVPGRAVAAAARQLAALLAPQLPLVNVAKALERDSGRRISEVVAEARGEGAPYAALAGGMIAAELASGQPLGAVVASVEAGLAAELAALLQGPGLRMEVSIDVAGLEYAAALKNVLVIGAGFLEGLGYPLGSCTRFLSLAAAEVEQLAVALGGTAASFAMSSQCWGNDLVLSAFGTTRSRAFGVAVAEALRGAAGNGGASSSTVAEGAGWRRGKIDEVRASFEARLGTLEGFYTVQAVPQLQQRASVPVPRLMTLTSLLAGEVGVAEATDRLLD